MDNRKIYINQKESSIMLILLYCAMNVVSFIVMLFFKEQNNAYYYTAFLVPQIVYIIGFFVYYKVRGIKSEFNLKSNFKRNKIFYIVAVFIGAGLFFFGLHINYYLQKFFSCIGIKSTVTLPQINGWYDYLLMVFIIGILPSIGEELLYRKALGDGLEKLGIAAPFIMALIFSLSHLNLEQTVHQFFVGFILSLLYISTKDVLITALAHATNNILVILLNFLTPSYIWEMPQVLIGCAVGGLVLGGFGLFIILRKNSNRLKHKSEKFNIYLIIMLIIMVILWLAAVIAQII